MKLFSRGAQPSPVQQQQLSSVAMTLSTQASRAVALNQELADLNRREKETSDQLKRAAEQASIESADVVAEISTAKAQLIAIESRRKRLNADLAASLDEAKQCYFRESARWNGRVDDARRQVEEQRLANELPFWLGDEQSFRRYWTPERMAEAPIFHQYRRAMHHPSKVEKDGSNLVDAINSLAGHIERHCKNLGWE